MTTETMTTMTTMTTVEAVEAVEAAANVLRHIEAALREVAQRGEPGRVSLYSSREEWLLSLAATAAYAAWMLEGEHNDA